MNKSTKDIALDVENKITLKSVLKVRRIVNGNFSTESRKFIASLIVGMAFFIFMLFTFLLSLKKHL